MCLSDKCVLQIVTINEFYAVGLGQSSSLRGEGAVGNNPPFWGVLNITS